jgi:hypothetical protein
MVLRRIGKTPTYPQQKNTLPGRLKLHGTGDILYYFIRHYFQTAVPSIFLCKMPVTSGNPHFNSKPKIIDK